MLDINPVLLKSICICRNISVSGLYKLFELQEYFTVSYFYQVINESKPVTDKVKEILNYRINETLTTEELIKVIKLQEYIR